MSRIHEALKKAEQERAANQGAVVPPGLVTSPVADPPVYADAPAMPPLQSSTAAVRSAMPAFAGPLSLDTLLARCAQTEWKPEPTAMLFMSGDDTAVGTEEYRTLRSRLYHMREKMTLKTLLVTSALPKEGKSFTSANLAQVMVMQHGRRALLIDADLRGPRLHLMLGTEQSPGLSDYLQGKADEVSIVQRGPLENLFFIPSGSGIEDPSELVGNGRLKMLLQRLEPLFDWIIIDSPPAIPVSDASVLAKACDGVLMVVRSNSTPADIARKARQEFPDQALVGVVLNGTSGDTIPYARYYYEAYQKKGATTKA
jgi:protein-tyrosine kinase